VQSRKSSSNQINRVYLLTLKKSWER